MVKQYYQWLGLPEDCTQEQIKKAYKKLALQHHPDKHQDRKEEAKRKFTQLAEAYAVLSDPQKRAAYDQQAQESSHSQQGGSPYVWKNPEFDPNFDHFAGLPQGFGLHNPGNVWNSLGSSWRFRAASWLREGFGEFTFEMAEQVFAEVAKDLEKSRRELALDSGKTGHKAIASGWNGPSGEAKSSENSFQWSKSIGQYQPKNSTLLEERVIERSGRRVLLRKYSVTENGKTHTQVRESILPD